MRARPLHDLSSRDLRPLLEEETAHWSEELLWDYADVSSAVAGGLDRKALTGKALYDGLRAVAYCYYMLDGGRAIVGPLFAADGFRGKGVEEALLDDVLAEAQSHPGNDRVECQTLFSTAPAADLRFTRSGFESRARHYLVRDLREDVAFLPHPFRLRPLRRDDLRTASEIIYRSHQGSLDAALNMTYSTASLCQGFVETLALRAGCGRFDSEASFVAESEEGPVGVLLASRLSRRNGHICQVSVLPEAQARGLGAVLVSSTLLAFKRQGLATASLSVTVDNTPAYRLYTRLAFRLRKSFAAHAWVRPPARIDLPA